MLLLCATPLVSSNGKPLMTYRIQESNPRPLLCRCLLLLSVCLHCTLVACPCVLFFPWTCWRCYIVATWKGFGIWGLVLLSCGRFLANYFISWMRSVFWLAVWSDGCRRGDTTNLVFGCSSLSSHWLPKRFCVHLC